LARRGATLSAAALGMALASETLTAAPAGLIVSVAGTALAGSATRSLFSETLLKITAMTKLKAGIITAVVIGGVTTSLLISTHAQSKLNEQEEVLRKQSTQLGQLAADNERLSSPARASNRPNV